MRIFGGFLTVASLALAAAGLAGATMITEGPQTEPSTQTDWSTDLFFAQFNSSLGTLTSVEVILNSTLTTTLTVTNTSLGTSSGTAKTELLVNAADPLLGASDLDYLSSAFGYSLAGGGSVVSGLLTKSSSSDVTYTNTNVLNEFTGGGNYDLGLGTITTTDLSNTGGNTNSSQVTNAEADAEVIFTYTPTPSGGSATPEPASLILMGSALLAAGLLRKRIKA
jgi:hypothetical protein